MKLRQKAQNAVLAASFITVITCRTPQDSQANFLATPATLTVTDKITLNENNNLQLNRQYNYVELDVTEAGLLQIEIFGSKRSRKFTSPVKISVAKATDPTVIEASGEATAKPYIMTQVHIAAKSPGKYLVLINHENQFKIGDVLSFTSTILKPTLPDQIMIPSITGAPGSWKAVLEYKGVPIRFGFLSPGLQTFQLTMNIAFASKNLVNRSIRTCEGCTGKFDILDFSNPTSPKRASFGKLQFNSLMANVNGAYNFGQQQYMFETDFTGIPSGAIVAFEFFTDRVRGYNGLSFDTTHKLDIIDLKFGSSYESKAIYDGTDFGLKFNTFPDTATSSHLKIVRFINLHVEFTRIWTAAGEPPPLGDVDFKIVSPSDRSIPPLVFTEKVTDNIWTKKIARNFNANNEYVGTFTVPGLQRGEIVKISGLVSESSVTIPDGGKIASTGDDHGQVVTATPPNKYDEDMNVPPGTFPAARLSLASKTVLAAMEATRGRFHERLPPDSPRDEHNTVEAHTISLCLGNEAAHWSDISIHYYCQFNGKIRACYTGTIRNKVKEIYGKIASMTPPPSTPEKIALLANIRSEAWRECSELAAIDEDWKWLVENQEVIFQYIMNSQTYAFDRQQQQDVINKFYRVNDPTDKEECNAKRPTRAIDPTDGTHCLADKKYVNAMQSAGR